MRRILILSSAGLFAIALHGCCKKPSRSVETSDSVRVERVVEYRETLRDTVVYVTLPIETKETVRRDSSFLETSLANSFARIESDGSLYHTLRNRSGNLGATVQVTDRNAAERIDSVRIERVVVVETVKQRYVPRFYKICLVISIIAAAYTIYKIHSKFKNIIKC